MGRLKNIHRRIAKTAGFTLTELIIVIAVLGIIAVIAVPRFVGQTTSAQNRVDEANAKLFTNIANIQHEETGSYPSWSTPFTILDASTTPYLQQDVEIQNSSNEFNYNPLTGIVTISSSGGAVMPPALTDEEIIKAELISIININVSNPTGTNPLISVPAIVNGVSFKFIGSNQTSGNEKIEIMDSGNQIKVSRNPGGIKTFTVTLQGSLNGKTETKLFTLTVPSGTGTVTAVAQ